MNKEALMLIPKREKMPAKVLKQKLHFVKSIELCIAAGFHGRGCIGGLDPAHFKRGSYAGKNEKNHKRINPMCRGHHTLEGNMGEKLFWGDRLEDAEKASDAIHAAFEENNLLAARAAVLRFIGKFG